MDYPRGCAPDGSADPIRARYGIVDIYDDYAYAQVLGSFEPFRYWLRRDADSEGLLLVSYFGFVQTMLCELETVTPKGVQ